MRSIIEKIKQSLKRFADDLPRDLIRRGSALGLVLVFMTFMLILGTGLLTVGQYMVVQSRTIGEADKSYYAAESAAQLAAQLLLKELATNGRNGSTSGVLVNTVASIATLANPNDNGDVAKSADIQKMVNEIFASLATVYDTKVKNIVETYPDPSSPGFNGCKVELFTLRMTSTDGIINQPVDGSIATEATIKNMLDKNILLLEGTNNPDNFYTDEKGIKHYYKLGVYFANPNFTLTARSGGRVVEVNTNVDIDFKINIVQNFIPAAPVRVATLSDIAIETTLNSPLTNNLNFRVVLSGDKIANTTEAKDTINNDINNIMHGIPNGIKVSCDVIDETTLRFHVSGTPTQTKSGPIRITLPGEILKSGRPLNMTQNTNSFWKIVNNQTPSLPSGILYNGGVSNDNGLYDNSNTGLAAIVENIVIEKREKAKSNYKNKDFFISNTSTPDNSKVDNNVILSDARHVSIDTTLTLGVLGRVTEYPNLEYIEASSLKIVGEVICPNLKGIYVSNSIVIGTDKGDSAQLNTLEYSDGKPLDKGIRTKIRSGDTFWIFTDAGNTTQLNWCEIYTTQFFINYGNLGKFVSNSVFYLNLGNGGHTLSFSGNPSLDHGGVVPQYYIGGQQKFTINNEATHFLGCFFVTDNKLFNYNSPNLVSGGMHGVFLGDFTRPHGNPYKKDVFDSISDEEWSNSVWNDENLKNVFSNSSSSVPIATASIIDKVTISGKAGTELARTYSFDVLISNDTLAAPIPNFNYSDLLWNSPDSIDVTCKYAEDEKTLEFTVSGTPLTPLKGPIDILIPGVLLRNNADINVELREDAIWDIEGKEDTRTATSSVIATFGAKGATLHDITGE